MTPASSVEAFADHIRELCALPHETEWVEFKHNNSNPDEIGINASALANSAALCGKPYGFIVWGVEDGTHTITGTTFRPAKQKKGNEEFENWLTRALKPNVHLRFTEGSVDDHHVVLLEVAAASHQPIAFKETEHVRVGSYSKRLRDNPEKERALWRLFDQVPFEACTAEQRLASDVVLNLLDYPAYFQLLGLPLPTDKEGILQALAADRLIEKAGQPFWRVTNLGAVLFARHLPDFASVQRKAVRVVQYKGSGRLETLREQVGEKGYATGFEGLIAYINGLLPSNEIIQQALRREVPVFPELAVRELVANALLHQDFTARGTGPMVEIFSDRMEITNPGRPLVSIERLLDTPPRSRNETLAAFMRRVGVCEERGSGIDKVVSQTELYQLPAPRFEVTDDTTRVVLLAPIALNRMERDDRVTACYLHACLKRVNSDFLTNASVRERFGIEAKNSATASRLIKEAVEAGMIHPYDPDAGRKFMKYVPFWAS
jgi:ATP-dependent DNA helicase RecG